MEGEGPSTTARAEGSNADVELIFDASEAATQSGDLVLNEDLDTDKQNEVLDDASMCTIDDPETNPDEWYDNQLIDAVKRQMTEMDKATLQYVLSAVITRFEYKNTLLMSLRKRVARIHDFSEIQKTLDNEKIQTALSLQTKNDQKIKELEASEKTKDGELKQLEWMATYNRNYEESLIDDVHREKLEKLKLQDKVRTLQLELYKLKKDSRAQRDEPKAHGSTEQPKKEVRAPSKFGKKKSPYSKAKEIEDDVGTFKIDDTDTGEPLQKLKPLTDTNKFLTTEIRLKLTQAEILAIDTMPMAWYFPNIAVFKTMNERIMKAFKINDKKAFTSCGVCSFLGIPKDRAEVKVPFDPFGWEHLTRHFDNWHNEAKVCGVCQERFRTGRLLQGHILNMKKKPTGPHKTAKEEKTRKSYAKESNSDSNSEGDADATTESGTDGGTGSGRDNDNSDDESSGDENPRKKLKP